MDNYVIITCANDLYINTIIDFILSYKLDMSNLLIYDLGFNNENLEKILYLKQKYNFNYEKFDFSIYPNHVNLNIYNKIDCSYAFKPILLYNEANKILSKNKDTIIIYTDSSNRFDIDNINMIYNLCKLQGIYAFIANDKNTIESIELNHRYIISQYGISRYEHINELVTVSACLVAIDYNSKAGNTILNRWYNDSLDKNKILPDGINRNNNRQDQTLLSIIIYLYEKENKISFNKSNFNISVNNKKDKFCINDGYYRFRLFNKNNLNLQLATIYCKDINEAIAVFLDRKDINIIDFINNYIMLP